MTICLSKSYPKKLVEALQLLHSINPHDAFEITWDKDLSNEDAKNTVVFLVDRRLKGLEASTEKYLQNGFKVFALKISPHDKVDLFQIAITVMGIWSKVLHTVKTNPQPFGYRFHSTSTRLIPFDANGSSDNESQITQHQM